jgi:hypothetical protein
MEKKICTIISPYILHNEKLGNVLHDGENKIRKRRRDSVHGVELVSQGLEIVSQGLEIVHANRPMLDKNICHTHGRTRI